MEDRSESSMLEINKVSDCFPKKHLKPLSDRDKEFSCREEVEKMGIDFYFAEPYYYCSRQRSYNENSSGLLRESYSKKTDISKVGTEELIGILMLINSRPRKCLNYATLIEKFLHEIG